MSEIAGSLFLKLPDDLLNYFKDDPTEVSWDVVNKILSLSGLPDIESIFNYDISFLKKEGFSTEGAKVNGQYVLIFPFSDIWRDIIRTIVEKGNGLEVYCAIDNDYGSEYHALSANGERYTATVDFEGDEEADPKATLKEFLIKVPENVKELFSDYF